MADSTTPVITAPTIAPPATKTYTQDYQEAAANIAPAADAAIAPLTAFPGLIQSDASKIATTYEGEIPTVTNIYTDLAKNLALTYGQQTDTLTTEKTAAVGTQKAAAAKGGLDTTQGYQAAITQGIQKSYDTQIQSVLDQYGVQSDQLMQEASKSISDLVAEAQTAIMQGDTSAAQITGQIASLKLQEQQMITTAASSIQSADTTAEKAYWQQTYQSAILDIRQQTLDLQAQKVAKSESAGPKLNNSTLTSYGTAQGLSSDDIQGAIDYGTQNGYTQNMIEQMMLTAANANAKKSAAATTTKSGGGVLQTIGNDVSSAYSWLTHL